MTKTRRTEPITFNVMPVKDVKLRPLKESTFGPSIWGALAKQLVATFEEHVEAKKKNPQHTPDAVCMGLEGKEPEEARVWAQNNAAQKVRALTKHREAGQLTAKCYVTENEHGEPVGLALAAAHYFPRERRVRRLPPAVGNDDEKSYKQERAPRVRSSAEPAA